MEGLKQWRQYLIGSNQFEVWTDHKNLGYFKKPQKLNHRQARWMTELQEYDFQLIHKPGSSQKKVDALSRRPDHTQGKDNNTDQTLLKGEWFRNVVIQKGEFWREIEEAEEFIEEEVRDTFWRRPDQSLAGTVPGRWDDGIRFWTYTTVDTASAQYLSSIPDSAIIERAPSRIVCMLCSAAPFCW